MSTPRDLLIVQTIHGNRYDNICVAVCRVIDVYNRTLQRFRG